MYMAIPLLLQAHNLIIYGALQRKMPPRKRMIPNTLNNELASFALKDIPYPKAKRIIPTTAAPIPTASYSLCLQLHSLLSNKGCKGQYPLQEFQCIRKGTLQSIHTHGYFARISYHYSAQSLCTPAKQGCYQSI